jgi:anthranilate/para-aminobenzoate synthase component II
LLGEQVYLPDCLLVNAQTADGLVMGIRHRTYATHGIQFHPESIGTPRGKDILTNFLNISVKASAEEQP